MTSARKCEGCEVNLSASPSAWQPRCRQRAAGGGNCARCHEKTIDWRAGRAGRRPGLDRSEYWSPLLIYCAEQRCEGQTMQPVPAAGCGWKDSASRSFDDFVARHSGSHLHALSRPISRGRQRHATLRKASSTSPRPGPARSTGSGPAACCASCAMASAARVRAARRRPAAATRPRPDPGAPAARRQHRHGGARHGQLRPRASAPGRPARRLAQREGAHCGLRRQFHHRRRAGLSQRSRTRWPASTGSAPLQRGSATSPSPCSRPSRPWPRCAGGWRTAALRHPVRAGAQRSGDRGDRQRGRRVMAPVNPNFASLNLAQAALLLSYEWMKQAGQRHARPGHHLRGAAAAGPEDPRLAAGNQGGAAGLLRAAGARARGQGLFQAARKAPQHGAKHAHHVHPDGRNGTGNPHPARNRQGPGARQAIRW